MALRPVLAAAVVVLALTVPSVASAQMTSDDLGGAPDPATEQYRESVSGDRDRRAIPRGERRELARSGPDGAALVTAVEGPAAQPGAPGATTGATPGGASDRPATSTKAAPAAPTDRPDDVTEASLGPVPLWLAIVLIALVGIAASVARRRRTS